MFFKWDGVLHIAQRNGIFTLGSLDGATYRGLKGWLNDNGTALQDNLHEGAALCCEWIAMGQIKYGGTVGKCVQFAKANVELTDRFNLVNILYTPDLFKWSYVGEPTFPHVPIAAEIFKVASIEYLDDLYDLYCSAVGRNVEGFVVVCNNGISKYVRMKNGKMKEHNT